MDSSGGNDHEEEGPLSEREGNTSSRPSPPSLSKTTPRKNDLAFPMRLHEMIQWVESNYPDSSCPIHWLSSGRAFMIRDHDELTTVILPRFFNQSKIESFARKLNRWGFNIIRSGPEKGAYMHKDFVRWEEPLSITSMSKDKRRKSNSTSSKASSVTEEKSPPQNKLTSQTALEDGQKRPARKKDNTKNDPVRRKRSFESLDPSGQYHQAVTSPDSLVHHSQTLEIDEKMPPRPHVGTNLNYPAAGGDIVQQSTNDQTSWNQGLLSSNPTESLFNNDDSYIRGGQQNAPLNESISSNRLSGFPQYLENPNSPSLHTQIFNRNHRASLAPQPMNLSSAQTEQFNTRISDNSIGAAGNTDTNTMLTSFNNAAMSNIGNTSMPTATLTKSAMHGFEVGNISQFTSNVQNDGKLNTTSTDGNQAFRIQQLINFPPAQHGQINAMMAATTNTNAENFRINMMPSSNEGMAATIDDLMISYNTQRNASIHRFGTADVGNINFQTTYNNVNVAGGTGVETDDIFSPLAIFSPNVDRDVAEGRITFTTVAAVAARDEDHTEDAKVTSRTLAGEEIDDDQIDLDLSDYFQRLEQSVVNEQKEQRRQ
ncbi:hypothetical protein ACHAXS_006289 [Conticribra weissflogii]